METAAAGPEGGMSDHPFWPMRGGDRETEATGTVGAWHVRSPSINRPPGGLRAHRLGTGGHTVSTDSYERSSSTGWIIFAAAILFTIGALDIIQGSRPW